MSELIEKSSLDLPNNSNKAKKEEPKSEEREHKEAVATGVKRKRSLGSRIKDALVSDDVGSIKNYILSEVIVPSVKDMISEGVKNAIDILLYGEIKRRPGSISGAKVSYEKYYDKAKKVVNDVKVAGNSRFNVDDIAFSSRPEAQDVLDKMYDDIEHFGMVSVADFYDFCEQPSTWQDNKWGWRNISSASIQRNGGYYYIHLPKVEAI